MIRIVMCNDCSPELVQTQYESFRKHLQEDFEMIVCNSESMSREPWKCRQVNDACRSLGIITFTATRDAAIENYRNTHFTYGSPESFFNHEGKFATPGNAGNYLMQWSWEKIVCKLSGPVFYTHSDVFLIEPVRLSDWLRDYDILSVLPGKSANEQHGEIRHLWEPFLLFNMDTLPDPGTMVWWPSEVEGEWLDTGGRTYYYLEAHKSLKVFEVGQNGGPTVDPVTGDDDDPNVDFHPSRYRFLLLPDGKRAFHYLSGTGWCTFGPHGWNWTKERSDEYHHRKLAWTRNLVGL